jgi:hypothetical protein
VSAIGDRISQLSSAASVYATNSANSTDYQVQADNDHAARLALDEMTRLSLLACRTSTGGQVTSTSQANTVALSAGVGLLASTRYLQSGQP